MEYLESSIWISGGEFPFIRFGSGKKNLGIIAGMNMTGLTGLGRGVSGMYRDYTEEYTVYAFDRLKQEMVNGYKLAPRDRKTIFIRCTVS